MVNNNKCEECNHNCICKKKTVLEKFDSDSRKFIGVDITMENCDDYSPINQIKKTED